MASNGRLQVSHQQRRSNSLTADVADQKGHSFGVDLKEIVQVSANLPGGQRSALTLETIRAEVWLRQQLPLYFARNRKLCIHGLPFFRLSFQMFIDDGKKMSIIPGLRNKIASSVVHRF